MYCVTTIDDANEEIKHSTNYISIKPRKPSGLMRWTQSMLCTHDAAYTFDRRTQLDLVGQIDISALMGIGNEFVIF